jgi:lipopolysaccharide export system permease protein
MQALGVSPAAVLAGPLALGLVLSGVLALLVSSVQPWGMAMVRVTANDIIRRNLMHDLKPGVFHDEVNGMTLYLGERDPRGRWRDVLLFDARDPAHPLLVTAPRGEVQSTGWEDGVLFELDDGEVHRAVAGAADYSLVSFAHATIRAGIGESLAQKNQFQRAREDRTPGELLEAAREARARGQDGRPFEVTFHWRLGQMFMPLAFAFLGVPLALLRRRGGRGWGVLFTLGGYIGFYVVARLAVQLADKGTLPPLVAGQAPNVVFIALGLAVLARVVRRGSA